MNKPDRSKKLKGNQYAKIGKVGSTTVRIPSRLMDTLHECMALEGEVTLDKSRIAEYAIDMLESYARTKIEHVE
jgi:ABC-type phosphate transport system ATPase subunit